METIKLKSAEKIFKECITTPYPESYRYNEVINSIKEAQRNAIEYTLKVASENADADYNITESFDRITGEDIEVYVINSSITDLRETIFKDNNL